MKEHTDHTPEIPAAMDQAAKASTQDLTILSAQHAMNIVGRDIYPGAGDQPIIQDGNLTDIGKAYAELGNALHQWQVEYAVKSTPDAIQAKRNVVDEKIEALVGTSHDSLTIRKNNDRAAAESAAAANQENPATWIKAALTENMKNPKSALYISSENVIRKQIEIRAMSKGAIEPSEKFDHEWFKKDGASKQDNKPRVNEDGSITMDALRTENDGTLLGRELLELKGFNPYLTYKLETSAFRTESGAEFMPIDGTVGFMKIIRENGGQRNIQFQGQKLTLDSWAIDSKYNPSVVKKNRGFLEGIGAATTTYAVDREVNIAAGRKLDVEIVLSDAYDLVLQDMKDGTIEKIDPSNRAMMNLAVLSKVDTVINTAKEKAEISTEKTGQKSMFSFKTGQPDPAKELREKAISALTDKMSPEEKRQATLIIENKAENTFIVNTGIALTEGEDLTSPLMFEGGLLGPNPASGQFASIGSGVAAGLYSRQPKMDKLLDKVTQDTPPSQQAVAIGIMWHNSEAKPESPASQKIIEQQAERIHKNIVAAQGIRGKVAELDNAETTEVMTRIKTEIDGSLHTAGVAESDRAQVIAEARSDNNQKHSQLSRATNVPSIEAYTTAKDVSRITKEGVAKQITQSAQAEMSRIGMLAEAGTSAMKNFTGDTARGQDFSPPIEATRASSTGTQPTPSST
jgi:hypothetical protein